VFKDMADIITYKYQGENLPLGVVNGKFFWFCLFIVFWFELVNGCVDEFYQ